MGFVQRLYPCEELSRGKHLSEGNASHEGEMLFGGTDFANEKPVP